MLGSIDEISTPRQTASASTALKLGQYNYPVRFDNGIDADTIYAIVHLYDTDTTTGTHKAKRPEEDSLPWAVCAGFPAAKIDGGSVIQTAAFMDGLRPIYAVVEGSELAIGDECGTQADSFKLKKDNTGFIITKIVDETEGRCLVRPFSSGGSQPVPEPGTAYTSSSMSVNMYITAGSYDDYETPKAALNTSIDLVNGQLLVGFINQTGSYFVKCASYGASAGSPSTMTISIIIRLYDDSDNVLGYIPIVQGSFGQLNDDSSDYNYIAPLGKTTDSRVYGIGTASEGTATKASVYFSIGLSGLHGMTVYGVPFTQSISVAAYEILTP